MAASVALTFSWTTRTISAAAETIESGDMVVVIREGAEVKVGTTVVARLPKGELFRVTGTSHTWVGAGVDKQGATENGWVHVGDVALADQDSIDLEKLQEEHLKALRELVEFRSTLYREGRCIFSEISNAQIALVDAQLDYEQNPERRIALLEGALSLARQQLELAEAHLRIGRDGAASACEGRALVARIGVKLLRERIRQKQVAEATSAGRPNP
jgi:hypothetical protein